MKTPATPRKAIINVTREFLKDHQACSEGFRYWCEQNKPKLSGFIGQCITDNHYDWAHWLIVRCMTRKQYLQYSIYAAKQCVANFEKEYPEDKRVSEAINAAQLVLKNDTVENRSAAESAAKSAESAAWSARSVARSAESAAWSAESEMQIKILRYGLTIVK